MLASTALDLVPQPGKAVHRIRGASPQHPVPRGRADAGQRQDSTTSGRGSTLVPRGERTPKAQDCAHTFWKCSFCPLSVSAVTSPSQSPQLKHPLGHCCGGRDTLGSSVPSLPASPSSGLVQMLVRAAACGDKETGQLLICPWPAWGCKHSWALIGLGAGR